MRYYEINICVHGYEQGPWYTLPYYTLKLLWWALSDIQIEKL